MDERRKYSPEPARSLYTLLPTNNSLLTLEHSGRIEEAKQLRQEMVDTTERLMDFDNQSLIFPDLLEAARIAARAGSVELLDLVKVRMFYAIPTLEPAYLSQAEKDLIQASADTFRNAAVAKRDEGLRLRKEGKLEEAENALLTADMYLDSAKSDMKIEELSELSVEERFEAVVPTFERIRQQLDRAEFVDLFFDRTVVEAVKDISETTEAIIEGRLTVEGIDRRWLTVADKSEAFNLSRFPQALKASRRVEEYVAQKFALELYRIHCYQEYSLQEFLRGNPDVSPPSG